MMECADAAGAVIQPPLLGDLHEIRNAVHRQRRMNHQDEGNAGNQGDRYQVLVRLVRQLFEYGRVH
jgi:hypothetical protein